jgi:hypothetical protein
MPSTDHFHYADSHYEPRTPGDDFETDVYEWDAIPTFRQAVHTFVDSIRRDTRESDSVLTEVTHWGTGRDSGVQALTMDTDPDRTHDAGRFYQVMPCSDAYCLVNPQRV